MSFFFFFSSRRRHTRSYGDWSSDVCSSDLARAYRDRDGVVAARVDGLALDLDRRLAAGGVGRAAGQADDRAVLRSEERRVGKECRCRGWAYHEKKEKKKRREEEM